MRDDLWCSVFYFVPHDYADALGGYNKPAKPIEVSRDCLSDTSNLSLIRYRTSAAFLRSLSL